MFISLMMASLVLSAVVCYAVNFVFKGTIKKLLYKVVSEDLASAFHRYLQFAIFVIGIGGGVRLFELEKYINPTKTMPDGKIVPIILDSDRWVLEMVRTVIETLQSIAWLLFFFFIVILIAYLIVSSRQRTTN